MSINSLMISRIPYQYTAEYIANVFWNQRIAQVSTITLFPYLQGQDVFQRAYVTIGIWSDSEVAYNLIQRLKDNSKRSRIVHQDDLWWPVRINTHIAGFYYLDRHTTVFPENYFERPAAPAAPATPVAPEAPAAAKPDEPTSETITESTEKVWDPSVTLQSIRSAMSKYSPQDPMALMTLEDIKHEIKSLEVILCQYTQNSVRVTLRTHQLMALQDIKNEIQSHEDILRRYTLPNSQNVTLRPHQMSFKY